MVIASIRTSVENAFTVFFAWVPQFLGALAILLIGYVVAKVVGKLVARVTHHAGLDRALHGGPGGNVVQRSVSTPSRLLGSLVFWLLFLGALSLAASALGIAALTAFIASVFAYLPNVLAALFIFLVAGALAAAVANLVGRVMGPSGAGKVVAAGVPILIMTIATFMILDQLKIAHAIVVITYTALVGAIALASALAFGLGGRDVAGRMLEGAESTVRQNKDVQQSKEQWTAVLAQGSSGAAQKAGGGEEARYSVTETPATPTER